MPNHLSGATSPYLLQHQNNPVDWYPWCDEALDRAKSEDKPIFLSIGYSACHWCHVMEHESFENIHIAKLLNDHFISIKVDREQRPDLDQIYMQVVQMLTGSGGWPMSVFLTPDTKPFYGGTYWPPENRWGRPGFDTVLRAVLDGWNNKRESVIQQSEEIVGHLNASIASSSSSSESSITIVEATAADLIEKAETSLLELFDPRFGGFGAAPKFPHATDLRLLMQRMASHTRTNHSNRLQVVTKTLDGMAQGGIYDHLGGGFARYSVDEKWLVPHFEKMLYDNALLASAYLDGYRITQNPFYEAITRETLDYVLRDMTDTAGGFYSAEDADSEGEEGKFYVWKKTEIESSLETSASDLFCEVYGVTSVGNFEGHNILYLPQSFDTVAHSRSMSLESLHSDLRRSRELLFEAREKRVRPGRDDKVLVSWNALMIMAMAEAGLCLEEKRYLEAAQKAADFLLRELRDSQGRLLHVWRNGRSEIGGFLDDYAYLANALLTLWESDGDPKWLIQCVELVDVMNEYFTDPAGGYFFTAHDAESLITRAKDSQDGSVPSGNAMAAHVLVRLWHWTENDKYRQRAQSTIELFRILMERAPSAAGQMLIGLDLLFQKSETIVVITKATGTERVRQAIAQTYSPYRRQIVISEEAALAASGQYRKLIGHWIDHRGLTDGQEAILYRCVGNQCDSPIAGTTDHILQALKDG